MGGCVDLQTYLWLSVCKTQFPASAIYKSKYIHRYSLVPTWQLYIIYFTHKSSKYAFYKLDNIRVTAGLYIHKLQHCKKYTFASICDTFIFSTYTYCPNFQRMYATEYHICAITYARWCTYDRNLDNRYMHFSIT